jgi:DNA-binding IclR family transcriptional regulator
MRHYTKSDSGLTNTLTRGLAILRCFTTNQPSLSPPELQGLTKIPKATLSRILKVLRDFNYLQYDEESRRYSLGISVFQLGFSVLRSLEGREVIRPYLVNLARKFNRSTSLLIIDNTEVIFVERIRVQNRWDLTIGVGSRLPAHNTAAGKAILAHLDNQKLREVMEELKKKEQAAQYIMQNEKKFFESLTVVRREGFAINDEESQKGVRAIAVPIFGFDGVAYAINVVAPPEEVSVHELKTHYAPALIDVGKEISSVLGYDGN